MTDTEVVALKSKIKRNNSTKLDLLVHSLVLINERYSIQFYAVLDSLWTQHQSWKLLFNKFRWFLWFIAVEIEMIFCLYCVVNGRLEPNFAQIRANSFGFQLIFSVWADNQECKMLGMYLNPSFKCKTKRLLNWAEHPAATMLKYHTLVASQITINNAKYVICRLTFKFIHREHWRMEIPPRSETHSQILLN